MTLRIGFVRLLMEAPQMLPLQDAFQNTAAEGSVKLLALRSFSSNARLSGIIDCIPFNATERFWGASRGTVQDAFHIRCIMHTPPRDTGVLFLQSLSSPLGIIGEHYSIVGTLKTLRRLQLYDTEGGALIYIGSRYVYRGLSYSNGWWKKIPVNIIMSYTKGKVT